MTDNDQAALEKKEAIKQLRAERKESIKRVAAKVKAQKKDLKLLKEQLGYEDGATAPEIAEAIKMEISRVIWYLATLKQYGEVAEGNKDGCFFRYKLVSPDSA
jgi:hypothetical protein